MVRIKLVLSLLSHIPCVSTKLCVRVCMHVWLDPGVSSMSSCVCRSELPREQYEGLRVELFSEIARSSGRGPRLVLIQLCRCLVAFAFATVPDVWPNTVVSMVHSLRDATRSIQVSPTHLLFPCQHWIICREDQGQNFPKANCLETSNVPPPPPHT